MAIISSTDVKSYLNITANTWDSQISAFISRCQAQAEKYCNQPFESQSSDLFVYGNGSYNLVLPRKNVTAINSLSYRTKPTEAWTAASSSTYALYQEGKVYYAFYETGFASGTYFKINLTAGFGLLNIPEDLRQIIIEMVAVTLKESNLLGDGILGMDTLVHAFGGETFSRKYLDLWESRWKPLLNAYRVPTL